MLNTIVLKANANKIIMNTREKYQVASMRSTTTAMLEINE